EITAKQSIRPRGGRGCQMRRPYDPGDAGRQPVMVLPISGSSTCQGDSRDVGRLPGAILGGREGEGDRHAPVSCTRREPDRGEATRAPGGTREAVFGSGATIPRKARQTVQEIAYGR